MSRLSVNVDHIATLREARGEGYPDPIYAIPSIELAGADGITVHLRKDRRHIQERDLLLIRHMCKTHLTLEMAPTEEMLGIADKASPDMVTLVPEEESEITTLGGLDTEENPEFLKEYIAQLKNLGCVVTLFIDPDEKSVKNADRLEADFVELHTGLYAESDDIEEEVTNLRQLEKMATLAKKSKLGVNAGHGLNYNNVENVAALDPVDELSIGHSIISRSVFVGIEQAVKDMIELINNVS